MPSIHQLPLKKGALAVASGFLSYSTAVDKAKRTERQTDIRTDFRNTVLGIAKGSSLTTGFRLGEKRQPRELINDINK